MMIIESYALFNILITVLLTGTITLVIVLLLMLIRWKSNIPDELFRKLMHFAAVFMTPLCLWFSIDFYVGAVSLFIFALGAAIILRIMENVKKYADFFVEREKHEIRKSFVSYCNIQACLLLVCGLAGDINIIYIELLVWAVGDASAALIGKKWGKKYFQSKFADNKKTYLGSVSMLAVTFTISVILLIVLCHYPVLRVLVQSLVIAVVATVIELVSRKGADNIIIPIAISLVCLCANSIA